MRTTRLWWTTGLLNLTLAEIVSNYSPFQASIEYAAHLMAEKDIKHLPIIDKRRLVGILTASMILEHAPDIGIDALF